MPNSVIIFTEGGSECGYGHITRCVALYDEIEVQEQNPVLIVNGDDKVIKMLGHRNYIIGEWYEEPEKFQIKHAIVDSYIATEETYVKIANCSSGNVLYIDDTNRLNYPSGIILNPSFFGSKLNYERKLSQKYLLGENFIILRKAFQEITLRTVQKSITDIAVIMGGSDVKSLNQLIVELIKREAVNATIHVVGKYDIKENALYKNIKTYENLNDIKIRELMLKCDLCISAAGQTTHELIATRLPFICVKVAENQENNIKGLFEKKIIKEYINCSKDAKELQQVSLLLSFEERQRQVAEMSKLNITKGVKNVIRELI